MTAHTLTLHFGDLTVYIAADVIMSGIYGRLNESNEAWDARTEAGSQIADALGADSGFLFEDPLDADQT